MEWLSGDLAQATILLVVGAALGVIGDLLVRLIYRRKPSIILIEKLVDTSLIEIHEEIHANLKLYYDERPIEGFYESTFRIRNSGSKPVQNVGLIFAIEQLSEFSFLEMIFTNQERISRFTVLIESEANLPEQQDADVSSQPVVGNPLDQDFAERDPDAFPIDIPFLNPYRGYDDYLGITIYSPRPIIVKGVVGKGVGWVARYVDRSVTINRFMISIGRATSPVVYLIGRVLRLLIR